MRLKPQLTDGKQTAAALLLLFSDNTLVQPTSAFLQTGKTSQTEAGSHTVDSKFLKTESVNEAVIMTHQNN